MKRYLFAATLSLANQAFAAPTPVSIFLREGFSSVLEFEEAPSKVILGDSEVFQVERLDKSLVIKPRVSYATTNMFVYFKRNDARLFILNASEDAEPTFHKKFSEIPYTVPRSPAGETQPTFKAVRIIHAKFKGRKDYLTVDFEVSANSSAKLVPDWRNVRLKYKDRYFSASKLWSERREVQKDSSVKSRIIVMKPNIPADLSNVILVVPLNGETSALQVPVRGGRG